MEWLFKGVFLLVFVPGLNAVTRAIDLLSKVLSPTIVGQIMTYGSLVLGAVVIAVWNVASLFVEYTLLCRIYRLVPRLASKGETEGMCRFQDYLYFQQVFSFQLP